MPSWRQRQTPHPRTGSLLPKTDDRRLCWPCLLACVRACACARVRVSSGCLDPGKDELAKMKPEAYLLNTARGGIVCEAALLDTLKAGRIAGVALDCFEEEPVLKKGHPLTQFPNVITAPHCIGWTKE